MGSTAVQNNAAEPAAGPNLRAILRTATRVLHDDPAVRPQDTRQCREASSLLREHLEDLVLHAEPRALEVERDRLIELLLREVRRQPQANLVGRRAVHGEVETVVALEDRADPAAPADRAGG